MAISYSASSLTRAADSRRTEHLNVSHYLAGLNPQIGRSMTDIWCSASRKHPLQEICHDPLFKVSFFVYHPTTCCSVDNAFAS